MIELNRHSKTPIGDQLVNGLARLAKERSLLPGARLPSVRQLARRLGISHSSVVGAYSRLASMGVIDARQGSGHYVAKHRHFSEAVDDEGGQREPIDAISHAMNALDIRADCIPVGSGFLPASWFDEALPSSVIGHILRKDLTITSAAPAQGVGGFRRQLACKLNQQGIPATPGTLVTTFGASHAFSLVTRALIRPGDPVIVEDPGYLVLHAQLASNGARLLPIPRQTDGPDMDAIEEAAKLERPRFCFIQTLFHNPTGSSMSAAKCHRLLALAERHNFLIVEDDVYGDLAPATSLRLAQLDELNRVFYVSSFTKVLSPGLRVGFVAAPAPFVETIARQKLMDVVSGSSLEESIVCDVLRSGRYAKHLERTRTRLLKCRSEAEIALSEAGVKLAPQELEGIFLWGKLRASLDLNNLVKQALANRIWLAKGSFFSPTGSYQNYLRFNAAYCHDLRLIHFLKERVVDPHDNCNCA
jgi:DNA-binding transcriptional MocR family regulator